VKQFLVLSQFGIRLLQDYVFRARKPGNLPPLAGQSVRLGGPILTRHQGNCVLREGGFERLVLLPTRLVETSAWFVLLSKRLEYWRWPGDTTTYTNSKKEMWGNLLVRLVDNYFCRGHLVDLGSIPDPP
jgi:hypothetical protein